MRRVLLGLGIAVLAAVWLGPLPQLARHAFFAHMTMHMGVVAVAAPLIALGLAGAAFPPLLNPIPASVLELVVVWAWHAPVLHHLARHTTAGLIAEQGTFLASGLLVWYAAFAGGGCRSAAGVIALLLTSMHMTLLGALLALAPRPLYSHTENFSGISALDDQHLGGAIMLLLGGASYLTGGLALTVSLLRRTALQTGEQG
jgi:putative membrane protein